MESEELLEKIRLQKFKIAAQIRESQFRQIELQKAAEKECLHRQGGNCGYSHHSAFFFLKFRDEIIGVCSQCQKKISSKNPEDAEYFKTANRNHMAQSGEEVPMSRDEQHLAAKEIYYNNLQNTYVYWQHWDHTLYLLEYRLRWTRLLTDPEGVHKVHKG